MTKYGPHRRVPYRREREGKTDYKYRKSLLRSGKPRLIARITLQHVRAQVATATPEGDQILASAFSKELSDHGWKGYTGNLPSAYLVGFLCGYRALEVGVEECILDIDRFVSSPQAKVFAVLKGGFDAGVNIPHDENIVPTEKRFRGEHISNYAQELKTENKKKYESQFSNYLKKDLPPEKLPEHFKEVKKAIKNQYGD